MQKATFLNALIGLTIFVGTAHAGDAWSYDTREDKMSGKLNKFASLSSDNKLDLPFPYKDPDNWGMLTVRSMGGKGPDVLVSVKKAQILCPGYGDGCTVNVRFDNAPPARYRAIGPSDHSHDAFFILDANRFVASAKKAKRILIAFTVYNAGEQVLEFTPTQPLQWGTEPAKKK